MIARHAIELLQERPGRGTQGRRELDRATL